MITDSPEETLRIGERLGRSLAPDTVITFDGELGAGKTTMIKGIVAGATLLAPAIVNSPTFVYLKIYEGEKPVHHFDLYRLQNADEFLQMGFDEAFRAGGLTCIEWAERIAELIPEDALCITIEHIGETRRRIRTERRGIGVFQKD